MESTLRGSVPAGTRLIETFGWTPKSGYARLDMHLARMAKSASQLGFDFDAAAARDYLKAGGAEPLRCRLTLGEDGFEFTSEPMAANPAHWTIEIAKTRLQSDNIWLQHKTTQRQLYDEARANLPGGVDELLFLNERGEVCEGTITNVFVTRPDGQVVTPPLSCGLLPGILRAELIAQDKAQEAVITLKDLNDAKEIHLGNSLRGLIKSELRNP